MSSKGREIVCRRCEEKISIEVDSCPHCGAEIRSRWGPIAMVVAGLVLVLGSLLDIGQLWPFALVSALLVFGGGYLLYDKRQRLR